MIVSLNKQEITQLCHVLVGTECHDSESLKAAGSVMTSFDIQVLSEPKAPESGFGVFQSLTKAGLPLTLVLAGDEYLENIVATQNLYDHCVPWLRAACDAYLGRGVKCESALAFQGLLNALEAKEDTDG